MDDLTFDARTLGQEALRRLTAANRITEQLLPADRHVLEYLTLPDGRRVTAAAAREHAARTS